MKNPTRRDMLTIASSLAVGATIGVSPAAAGRQDASIAMDDAVLALVDPELRPFARTLMAEHIQLPASVPDAVRTIRRWVGEDNAPPPAPSVHWEARSITGHADGSGPLVYIVNAARGGSRPGILYFHGGGFIAGSARGDIPALQKLATALDCTIVSVDYRLAPETRYAGAIEDNYAALRWMHGHGAELGVDPARLAVMGGSAGGGHAALIAIVARDRGEVPLVFQSLHYPMLDDRTGSSRGVPPHVGTLLWTAELNRFGWRCFLGSEPGRASVPKGAVPARVENLAKLPPAFIGVGSLDLFVNEDIDYARRLNEAGVGCELLVMPGGYHGFDALVPEARISRRFSAVALDALRRGLGIDPS